MRYFPSSARCIVLHFYEKTGNLSPSFSRGSRRLSQWTVIERFSALVQAFLHVYVISQNIVAYNNHVFVPILGLVLIPRVRN